MPLQPCVKFTSVDDHPHRNHGRRAARGRDGARERLAAEIESESAALAALGADSWARADLQLRQRRLSALKIALSHL